jgi:4-methylaminobutanoate oxidase (formaldehyde-forming)
MYHDEPIWRDDVIVGYITSGTYSYTMGCSLGMGYVNNPDGATATFCKSGNYEIEIACERYSAKASLKPFYDPKNERIRI